MVLDTANTYRDGAVLDSDAEVYELAVRVFYSNPKGCKPVKFNRDMLRKKVCQITGEYWLKVSAMTNFGLSCLLDAKIIELVGDDQFVCIHHDPSRIATLMRYQYDKIRRLEKEYRLTVTHLMKNK